jgi:hypothetical protein
MLRAETQFPQTNTDSLWQYYALQGRNPIAKAVAPHLTT